MMAVKGTPSASRAGFIDQAPTPSVPVAEPKSPPLTLEQANAVPDGMRAGTLLAAQTQVAQLQKYIQKNLHGAFDPVAAGIMVPRAAETKKRTRDKTRIEESEGGDAHLRGLAESARAKQLKKSQEAAAAAARKVARLEKKVELEESAAARLKAYEQCTPTCTCGVEMCPWAGLILCSVCGDIKKGACRKGACVADKAPLMLTMADPAPVLALPAPAQ